jgi:hypothetical protein
MHGKQQLSPIHVGTQEGSSHQGSLEFGGLYHTARRATVHQDLHTYDRRGYEGDTCTKRIGEDTIMIIIKSQA